MERTTSTIKAVIRSSVACPSCEEHLEAVSAHDRKVCGCGTSWVVGHEALMGHNTSILQAPGGQLHWEL